LKIPTDEEPTADVLRVSPQWTPEERLALARVLSRYVAKAVGTYPVEAPATTHCMALSLHYVLEMPAAFLEANREMILSDYREAAALRDP